MSDPGQVARELAVRAGERATEAAKDAVEQAQQGRYEEAAETANEAQYHLSRMLAALAKVTGPGGTS